MEFFILLFYNCIIKYSSLYYTEQLSSSFVKSTKTEDFEVSHFARFIMRIFFWFTLVSLRKGFLT